MRSSNVQTPLNPRRKPKTQKLQREETNRDYHPSRYRLKSASEDDRRLPRLRLRLRGHSAWLWRLWHPPHRYCDCLRLHCCAIAARRPPRPFLTSMLSRPSSAALLSSLESAPLLFSRGRPRLEPRPSPAGLRRRTERCGAATGGAMAIRRPSK